MDLRHEGLSPACVEELRRALPGGRVLEGSESAAFAVDGLAPQLAVMPSSLEELCAAMRVLFEAGAGVIPVGGGTHVNVGPSPQRYDAAICLSGLSRVLEYEPDDLTAGLEAGVPWQAFQESLLPHRQWLALDPAVGARGTVGGVFASGRSGPRRLAHGSPRDKILGVTAVLADGTLARSGGRVVKNVSGYDLHRLYTGSRGTLALIAALHVRLEARPAMRRTLLLVTPRAEEALAACATLLASRLELGALTLLDGLSARSAASGSAGMGWRAGADERAWTVAVLFEGPVELVEDHSLKAQRRVSGLRASSLDGGHAETFWSGVAELALPVDARTDDGRGSWQVRASLLPREAAVQALAWKARLVERGLGGRVHVHAATGQVFLQMTGSSAEVMAELWARMCEEVSATEGTAELLSAPAEFKPHIPLWCGASGPLSLMHELKGALDPRDILSPGRLPEPLVHA